MNDLKRYVCALLTLCMFLQPLLYVYADEPTLLDKVQAPVCLLSDRDAGTVMLQRNGGGTYAPYDFSKIMTAILAIENVSPQDNIPFPESVLSFSNAFGNLAGVDKATVFTCKQHLYNLLLLYSDASANALAIHHSGSVKAFVDKMNEKAALIGMQNTYFTSPDGQDPDNASKTTAEDLAKLMAYAAKLPMFLSVAQTVTFELPTKDGAQVFTSRNHLFGYTTSDDLRYSAAICGFPSFHNGKADFLICASKNGKNITGVLLDLENAPKAADEEEAASDPVDVQIQIYKDAINLSEYGFRNFTAQTVSKEGNLIDQIDVVFGESPYVLLSCAETKKALLPKDFDASALEKKTEFPKARTLAPVRKGEELGTVHYFYEGNELFAVPLVAETDVRFSLMAPLGRLFLSRFNTVLWFFIVLFILIILLISNKKRKKAADIKRRRKALK